MPKDDTTSEREHTEVAVTIRLDASEAARMYQIISELRSAGLTDAEAHERLMMISGNCSASDIVKLRNVTGVASVREDVTYTTQSKM